jgi:hypothetical protein
MNVCVCIRQFLLLFQPPRKNNNKKEIDSALCCAVTYWNLKRNFFGRARSSSRRRSIYKRRSSTALLCRVGWCHPVSRQTRTRASPIQLLHVRQQEGVGEQGANGIQHGRRFYWHRSSRPSRRPSPHPAVKTTKFFTKERKGKKKQQKWTFWNWYYIHREIIASHYDFCNCVSVCACVWLCCSGQCVCDKCVCVCVCGFSFLNERKKSPKSAGKN